MKALVGAFNQEKALVGASSVIVQPVVEPMDRFAALVSCLWLSWGMCWYNIVIFPVHAKDAWRREKGRISRKSGREKRAGIKDWLCVKEFLSSGHEKFILKSFIKITAPKRILLRGGKSLYKIPHSFKLKDVSACEVLLCITQTLKSLSLAPLTSFFCEETMLLSLFHEQEQT